jgi:septal ring-binding cell division protein DamX
MNPFVRRATHRLGTILVVAGLLATGCASRSSGTGLQNEPGNWFCRPDPAGAAWDCVQDAELATNPPGRAGRARRGAAAASGAAASPLATNPEPSPQTPFPPSGPVPAIDALDSGAAQVTSASTPADEPLAIAAGDTSDLPDWARLAWQPTEPLGLAELPPDFYAVQLVALQSRGGVEQYAREHGLHGLSSARIARDGEIFHVLLLGIYETRAAADRAAASLPTALGGDNVWVRTVRSIQEGMRAAEALAGG